MSSSESDELGRLSVSRKTGEEPFHVGGHPLDFDVQSWWRWVASDLLSNATRGLVAEYIVARALGLAESDVRDEWAPFDLQTSTGLKVEVKSAAYLQSWGQKRLSPIIFRVAKTRAWDPDAGSFADTVARQADVYVFALLAHTDKQSVDPLNLNQWRFYVVPAPVLDARRRSQHSITLNSLEALCGRGLEYGELRHAIETVHVPG